MATPLITVIGSLNTDIITRTSRIPAAGETLISKSFDTGSGGKGANQAVACARLARSQNVSPSKANVQVRMVGAVGNDEFGPSLVRRLKEDGIDAEGVMIRDGQKTGVAVVTVEDQTGENRILMSPNANYSLKALDFATLPPPLPNLIVLQLEIPLDTVLQILKVASEQGVEVLLNPAPAQRLPKHAYRAITHLIVNESEAAIVADTTGEELCWSRWGSHTDRIVDLGVRHVTITLGAAGVVYLDTNLQKVQIFSAEKVKVVDTTAAGDTFVGAYAVAVTHYVKSRDISAMTAAVKWANSAAAKTVEIEGAQSAIPWLDQITPLSTDFGEEGMSFDEWRRHG
ncbi:hypothetical protein MMC28_003888 [Mycoblastus sanguinarius]|nr:hypothetical protein [Mycoblastus sanguinarius]